MLSDVEGTMAGSSSLEQASGSESREDGGEGEGDLAGMGMMRVPRERDQARRVPS